jgi:hypothetical protein
MAAFPDQEPSDDSGSSEKKALHKRLWLRGSYLLFAGVLLMGTSFFINFLMFQQGKDFSIVMYILTGLGSACLVGCLYCYFEQP